MKIFLGASFQFHVIERISPNVVTEFNIGSAVSLGKMVRVHSGSKIKVRKGAKLSIGDNVKINYNCIIACHDQITIGEGTELGPSVYIYDHDHDYSCEGGVKAGKFKQDPVYIGDNSWIGANTVILRGTTIGKNCVIGAGCVVKGEIPDNTVYVQKREIITKSINIQ